MAHFIGSGVTSVESKCIHAGVNSVYASYALAETASGSTTIAIAKLPAGSRVRNATLNLNPVVLGTGLEALQLDIWINGSSVATLIPSATQAYTLSMSNLRAAGSTNFAALNFEVTSSANLVVTILGAVGTGTASQNISVCVDYVCEDDPHS